MRSDNRFFVDRGVGSRIVPDGLRAAGWIVTTMDERYGAARSQSVADEEWIRDAASAGEVIITKDRAVARRPSEAEVIYYTDARVLVSADTQLTGTDLLDRLIAVEPAVERLAASTKGPWVFGVYDGRIGRLRLNYPAS